jgi:hypothetical protein
MKALAAASQAISADRFARDAWRGDQRRGDYGLAPLEDVLETFPAGPIVRFTRPVPK